MKKTKRQKPIEIDASFRYKCPSIDCGNEHWLFLRQAQVKNFKIVCECGLVFKPKQVKNIKIIYENTKAKKQKADNLSINLLNQCFAVLKDYGFSKTESDHLIKQAYETSENKDIGSLIKVALTLFGEKNG